MEFKAVRPDLVKYEMRQTTGTPAWEKEVKKPGAFGRVMSGSGRVLGSVAAPLSFLFPPAALAAAGMYGVASIGDQVQVRSYERAMEAATNRNFSPISFPGLDPYGVSNVQPTSTPLSPHNEMVMEVLFTRDAALGSMVNEL